MASSKTARVKVIRAFYQKSKVHHVGSVVDLPEMFAAEVVASNKAVPTEEALVEGKPPAKKRTAPAVAAPAHDAK